MNMPFAYTCVFLYALLCPLNVLVPEKVAPFPAASPESQGLAASALDELCGIVQGYVEAKSVVGAELLVIKNRFTVLHQAFGWRDYQGDDKVPMECDTIFNIRSMTKPVVGTAIQMLIDEGKLSPDDPVHRYLPAFETPACRPITIEHLLTHRSGLPLGPLMSNFHAFKNLDEVAAKAAEVGPEHEPGSGFHYSDPGTDVLGAVAAKVSGCSLDEFIQKRIIDPLGMKDTLTLFDREDARADRVAALFAGKTGVWQRVWRPYNPMYPFVYGAQGLYATPVDYARFMTLWMDGGRAGDQRLLSAEAVERGLTPISGMGGYPCGFNGLEPMYARMWMVYIAEGTPAESIEHAKRSIISHSGSDGTVIWAWPALDLIICYFSQSRGGLTALDLEAEIERLLIKTQPIIDAPTRHPER